jgi:hypothetical protein
LNVLISQAGVAHQQATTTGLVRNSRSTYLWLGFLVIFHKDGNLKSPMKISYLFVGLAEKFVISAP